jgi:hypothetical protein
LAIIGQTFATLMQKRFAVAGSGEFIAINSFRHPAATPNTHFLTQQNG